MRLRSATVRAVLCAISSSCVSFLLLYLCGQQFQVVSGVPGAGDSDAAVKYEQQHVLLCKDCGGGQECPLLAVVAARQHRSYPCFCVGWCWRQASPELVDLVLQHQPAVICFLGFENGTFSPLALPLELFSQCADLIGQRSDTGLRITQPVGLAALHPAACNRTVVSKHHQLTIATSDRNNLAYMHRYADMLPLIERQQTGTLRLTTHSRD